MYPLALLYMISNSKYSSLQPASHLLRLSCCCWPSWFGTICHERARPTLLYVNIDLKLFTSHVNWHCELTPLLVVKDHVLQRVAVHRGQSIVCVCRWPVVDVRSGPVVSLLKSCVRWGVGGVVGAVLRVHCQIIGGACPASLAMSQSHPQPQYAEVVSPGKA